VALRRSLLALAAVCVLGGFGEGPPALTQAVQSSAYTYFHYAAAVWWGQPVRVSIRATAVDGRLGGAIVDVRRGSRLVLREDVLLRHDATWRVVRTTLHVSSDARYCEQPLKGLERFFESCLIDEFDVSADPYVKGPLATRPATPEERARITATAAPRLGDTSCVRFDIRISRVDERYALVGYRYVPPFTKTCSPANGVTIVSRASGSWRVVGDGSSEFPCGSGAPGVMRSLLGTCVFGVGVR
jgi:hypothetical protein